MFKKLGFPSFSVALLTFAFTLSLAIIYLTK
jgi:hypothetical protein